MPDGDILHKRVVYKDWGVFVSYGQLLPATGLVAVTFNHRYLDVRDILDDDSRSRETSPGRWSS
jgi:hypothetical protein